MKVEAMARAAALLSNREDEFIKDGSTYPDEGGRILEICINAFNEVNRAVARKLSYPNNTTEVTPVDNRIDLTALDPPFIQILRVEGDGHYPVPFITINRDVIEVPTYKPVKITYCHTPPDLALLTDEPVYHEAQVDPMAYITLAAARLYQSDKKHETAAPLEAMHYAKMREVKPVVAAGSRRVPRRTFR